MTSVLSSPAYVLRLGPAGLTVIRALGRSGIPVVSFHSDPHDPAGRSRFARPRILPPIDAREDAWLNALLEEGRRLDPVKGVVFPIGDEGWLFLARHRETLRPYFRFALPDADNLEEWPGKPFQYRAAVEAGVPVPRTFFPRTEEEALAAAAALGFPCIIKPAYSHLWRSAYGWKKLAFVTTPDELAVGWRDAARYGLAVMLQEYIPGGDDQVYTFSAYLDRRSHPLAVGVMRKIRQYPPHFGAACCGMSVVDPATAEPLREMGLTLLRTIGFHGICGVEFKWDSARGFQFIEANVRPGTMTTAVMLDGGLNLAAIAYHDLLGQPVPPPPPLRRGRKVVLIGRDVKSFRYYKARGELTWWQWVRSLLGRTREYYWGWDDPAPFIASVRRLIRGAMR